MTDYDLDTRLKQNAKRNLAGLYAHTDEYVFEAKLLGRRILMAQESLAQAKADQQAVAEGRDEYRTDDEYEAYLAECIVRYAAEVDAYITAIKDVYMTIDLDDLLDSLRD